MFAVLKTGGKQYKVQSGDMLRVEKLAADAGETVQFNDILMIGGESPVVGAPMVADAAVQADVVDQIKGDKTINFVKRRRKHSSQRTKGHRQQLTLLRITEILASGAGKSGVKAALGAGSASAATAEQGRRGARDGLLQRVQTCGSARQGRHVQPRGPCAGAAEGQYRARQFLQQLAEGLDLLGRRQA